MCEVTELKMMAFTYIKLYSYYTCYNSILNAFSSGDNIMVYNNMEERIARLERLTASKRVSKNEFFDIFNKPKRAEEKAWVEKLFNKYPSLKRELSAHLTADELTKKSPFHLVLTTKNKEYRGLNFLISTKGGRDKMYCTVFDRYDSKIDGLIPFHIDEDINKVAAFILQVLNGKTNESFKNENISLSTFDCNYLLKTVEDNIKNTGAEADVTDDNGDYGFVNVGIFNPDFVTAYDVIAVDLDLFEVEHEDRLIGKGKSFEEVGKLIANHYKKNFL